MTLAQIYPAARLQRGGVLVLATFAEVLGTTTCFLVDVNKLEYAMTHIARNNEP